MKNTTLFFLINIFSGMGYSLVSPLFPTLGKQDKLNEEILGLIISTYSISNTILTPFIPALSKKISRIKLLCFATFFEATIILLYGFLPFIHFYPLLITIIFLLRIFHGFCASIIGILVYSLTISLSEENETQISLGNLEIGWSIGTSSGPLFASFFYKLGGYSLPFITLGLFLYISVYIAKSVNSEKLKNEEESEGDPPFISFLFHPQIFLILIAFIIGMIDDTFYYPCLTNHLTNNYNLSVSTASLFFIIPIITYIIILQFLDYLSAKFGIYIIVTCGLVFSTTSPFFLSPCPPIPKSIISIFIGFLISGLGPGPIFIPGLVALSKNILKIDSNIDELTANDISSALYNLTVSIGDFSGPIIGGLLTTKFDFNYCCFIIFLIGIFYLFIFIVYFFNNIKNDINKFINDKNLEIKESENILFDKDKNLINNEEISDHQISTKSLFNFNNSFTRNFKFESISLRRHSFYKFRRKEKLSKISLYSSLIISFNILIISQYLV